MKSALETAVAERKIEIAKSLLETRLSSEEISKHTGLTVKQIEKLRSELKKQN
jgi:thymidine kinase